MMKQAEPEKGTILVLNSIHGISGSTATDYTVELKQSYLIRRLKLQYFTLPSTTFNAGSGLNDPTWVFEEQGFPEITNAKLPGFFYTGSNIGTLLGAYLTSISPSSAVYTVALVPGLGKLNITNSLGTPFRFGGAAGTNMRYNPFYFSIGYSEVSGTIVRAFSTNLTFPATVYLLPCPQGYYINVYTDNSGFNGKATSAGSNLAFSFFVPEGNVSATLSSYSTNSTYPQDIENNVNFFVNKVRIYITDSDGKPYITEGGSSLIVLEFSP